MSKEITLTFELPDGSKQVCKALEGETILTVAHNNNLSLEGACGGSLACATCHVILEKNQYDALEDASEDEEDMLDLAYGLSSTSRLGCQIVIAERMDGMAIKIPQEE